MRQYQRIFLFFPLLLLSAQSLAVEKISLDIQQLFSIDLPVNKVLTSGEKWAIHNLSAYINHPFTPQQQFIFELAQIKIARIEKSNFTFKLICSHFQFSDTLIECQSGTLKLTPIKYPSLMVSGNVSFTYNLADNYLHLKIKNLSTGRAKGDLSLKYENGFWSLYTKINNMDLSLVKNCLDLLQIKLQRELFADNPWLNNSNGQIDFTLKLSGNDSGLKKVKLSLDAKNFNINWQQSETEILTENLNFSLDFSILNNQTKNNPQYTFKLDLKKLSGAVFVDPYYIELTGKEQIAISGVTDLSKELRIKSLKLSAEDLLSLQGSLSYDLFNNRALAYNLNMTSSDLKNMQLKYLNNLLAGTSLEGLKLTGKSQIKLTKQNQIANFKAVLQQINVSFAEQIIKNINAKIFWTDKALSNKPLSSKQKLNQKDNVAIQESILSWDKMRYKKMEIGKTSFSVIAQNNQVKANNAIIFPIFDGRLIVKNLQVSELFNDPKVAFDGLLEPVSLNLISQQFDWPLMDGKVSALIPHTSYSQKQLKLGGKLQFNVFDGMLSFDKVVIADPISDFSSFNANIVLNNINLLPLTKAFDFGKMEGWIEGYFNDLVLDNWQPSSFDMFIGTVKSDKSSHLISQRAVDNLSSMGGLPGVLSKSFMSIFENFYYDKLGLGCQLLNGRCKMRGIEQDLTRNAYYIVKGGGIPRIDIMGYETNVDWNTLIERLKSIQQSNQEAIIE